MAVGDVIVRVGADTRDFERNLNNAASDLQDFGAAISGIGKVGAVAFGALTVASTLAISQAVSVASEYESAFANVRKTTEATEAQFAELSKGIRDMSKEIPMSSAEIANLAGVAGQLGIKQEDILDFTRVAADMGVATTMSSENAAMAMARFANITGMSMNDISRLGSTVVHLGNNLAATEDEILNMGMRLAGAGNQVGMTEDQILAFAGSLASTGVRVEAGGSAFSRVFLEMNTAVKSGGEELDAFAKIAGVSSSEFSKAFEKDAAGATIKFIKGLDGIEKSGGDVAGVLSDLGLGEIRVRDALMRAAGASDLFTDSLTIGSDAWKENTALTDEAQERYNTFASKLKIFGNRLKDIILIIGTPLMEALSGAMDALDPMLSYIEELAAKFENASDSTREMVAKFAIAIPVIAALLTAIFGAVAIIGLVVALVGTLKLWAFALGTTVSGLLALIGTIAGAILIIPALIALAVAVVKNWDVVKNKTADMVKSVGKALRELPAIVSDVAKQVGDYLREIIPESVVDFIEDMTKRVASAFSDVVSAIKDALTGDFESIGVIFSEFLPSIIGLLVGGLPGLAITGARFLPALAEGITENIEVISETATSILTGLLEGLAEGFPILLEAGVEIIENLLGGFVEAAPLIIEAVSELVISFIEALTEYLPLILESGMTILTTLLEGITEGLPFIIEAVSLLVEFLSTAIAVMIPLLAHIGLDILMAIIDGIVEMLPVLIETATTLISSLIDTFLDLLPTILGTGVEILMALIDGIIDALPDLLAAAVDLIVSLLDTIISQLPLIIEAGVEILLALIDGIANALPELVAAGLTLIASLAGTLISMLPEIIAAGIKILGALVKGILQAVGQLLSAGFELMGEFALTIAGFVPKLLSAGVDLIGSLIGGIGKMAGGVLSAAKDIGGKVLGGIKSVGSSIVDAGKDLMGGLSKGISSMKNKAIDTAKSVGSGIKNTLTSFFGIKSPSRVMEKEVGKMLGLGLTDGMAGQLSAIQRMATKVSEAATPEQPKLKGIDIGDMQGHRQDVTADLQADAADGGTLTLSNDVHEYRGMLEGAVFNVREEADIDRIAEELGKRTRDEKTRKGRR